MHENRTASYTSEHDAQSGFVIMIMWILFLTLRVFMALVSVSYFVPDETWQSVEISHKLVFQSGFQTWEWQAAIRSYLHPFIFSIGLYLLECLHLDNTAYAVILVPRLMQALISTCGDVYICKFYRNTFNNKHNWFLLIYVNNWFINYCSSRTLINTFEMALNNIALYSYASGKCKTYVALISLVFIARPTIAVFWIPLVSVHLLQLYEKKCLTKTFFCQMAPTSLAVLFFAIALDSHFYGFYTIVPLNFLHINVIADVSSQYGVNPPHWYLTNFMPAIMNIMIVPLVFGIMTTSSKLLLTTVTFTFFVFSCIGHKEHRFLLLLVPILLCYAAQGMETMVVKKRSKVAFALITIFLNWGATMYLSLVHQTGPNSVMHHLATSNYDSVTFLTPCHSTPFYSHVHNSGLNNMRFLQCPPNFKPGEKDEQDTFFANPLEWMNKELETRPPQAIVCYDNLVETIKPFLEQNGYELSGDYFHTHFPEGRVGSRMLIYGRHLP